MHAVIQADMAHGYEEKESGRTHMMFSDWGPQWLEMKRCYVKTSTYAAYRTTMINHLLPAFGGMELAAITQERVQSRILYWAAYGRLDGRGGMSKKTIRDMVSVLKLCLRDAGAADGIGGSGMRFFYPVQERRQGQEEPVCGADTGTTIRTGDIGTQDGGRRVTESVLTQTQVMDYLRALRRKQTPQTLGISLCLYTGMRIGEICALQWQDIDLANRLVHVTKTLQRVYLKSPEGRGSSRVLITTPKSACSVRVIPLADEICGMLGRLASDMENYVVTGTKNYMEPRAYRRFYARFVEENALPYIRFHGLRHTFATRCIQAGADTKTVSELLGHSSVALTMNLYVHPQMEEKRRLVNLLALPS